MFLLNQNDINDAKINSAVCIMITDAETHHLVDKPLCIILYDIETKKQYVINFNHVDFQTWIEPFQPDLSKIKLYSPTKKNIISNRILTDFLIDLNFLIYPLKHRSYSINDYILKRFYAHKNRYKTYNTFPLVSLIEMCKNISIEMENIINKSNDHINDIKVFDDLYYASLFKLERNPISFKSNIIYSDYNPYTITNRPTNSSYGINLTALSKKDDTRTNLKTKFASGQLVQFDYSSFHVYLLTKMLNFDLPKNKDVYIALNEEYGFSNAITRNEIKMDFFKYIYGTKIYSNRLFDKLNKFKQSLYEEYNSNGYVTSFFLKRKILFNLKEIPQNNKVFNYYLQNAETEYNFLKILQINKFLNSKTTDVILYTYDSFLLDIPEKEDYLIQDIKNILESDGIPVNMQIGDTYGTLKDIY